ncbi:synaptogenesis protein syg-2 [Eurytemora carolleeae]|uniref:synaptogenesis protein syg-2 n=1 Tax=Eurytemora carolleeae TaxID=1294199 RepID=UPI000C786505|nr:synaptogenesis protein syg-2 [Eurytemora carolleeae]|eukprot:XP_023321520.1 synaptogenesis protein syg-2-like [Eurytemora affinis]
MNFHRRRFDIEGSRLSIRQVERGDAGTYLLFASNNIGKTELAIQIIVEYPARIVAVSSGIEAKEGETVKFLCKVDGNPITNSTVRWIGPQGPGKMLQKFVTFDENSTFTLTIPSVDKTDRGQYRCIADNGVHDGALPGRDTQLQVHFRPEIRKFSRFSKFSENRMFPTKIPCYAYGYPEVSIFWEKESEVGKLTPQRFSFPADGKAKQVESGTWLSELEINPVENSDFTLYRCSVNNSLGSDSHIIRIVHNSAPDPVSKLEVKQFENKTVRLRWEPGFNGGFDQEFIYRVREVSSDKVIYEGKARHEEMGPHKQFIEQYIILENLGDYAFSIKARNVQGDSAYSVEQFESLKAAEVQGHEENTLPRVVIVAIGNFNQ